MLIAKLGCTRTELRKEQAFELGETVLTDNDLSKVSKSEGDVAEEPKRPDYLNLLRRKKKEAKDGKPE